MENARDAILLDSHRKPTLTPAKQHLPKDVLLDLLPAAFAPWGASSWYPSRAPTEASVRQIEAELNVVLPPLFIEIAAACPSYGGWFGSIGDDVTSDNHILSINRVFHEEGLPQRYVLMNHGHDGDCDAWDIHAQAVNSESPIIYFRYDSDNRQLRGLRVLAASFAEYIDSFVRDYAPRCPVKGLRRRAKRLLAQHGNVADAQPQADEDAGR